MMCVLSIVLNDIRLCHWKMRCERRKHLSVLPVFWIKRSRLLSAFMLAWVYLDTCALAMVLPALLRSVCRNMNCKFIWLHVSMIFVIHDINRERYWLIYSIIYTFAQARAIRSSDVGFRHIYHAWRGLLRSYRSGLDKLCGGEDNQRVAKTCVRVCGANDDCIIHM